MKPDTFLFEIAWEVCNQIGGIFTYLKSKVPTMVDAYDDNYILIGPYNPEQARLDFKPITDLPDCPFSRTMAWIRSLGHEIHYGFWLLEDASPKVLLIKPGFAHNALNELKTRHWERHGISTIRPDALVDEVIAFGEVTRLFLTRFIESIPADRDVVAHFHDWMASAALPDIHFEKTRAATVYTCHGTLPGRYLAPNEPAYYRDFQAYSIQEKASRYGIENRVGIETAGVRNANVLVSVSSQVARECEAYYERSPDSVIRNGVHRRPDVGHEAFEAHLQNRGKIDAFVRSLFSPSYHLASDKTLYFFTSGRYEFKNKGFDQTLEAIAGLNQELVRRGSDMTVVFFIITKRPFRTIKPDVLEARQRFHALHQICKRIGAKLGPRIYSHVTGTGAPQVPDLNGLVDDELLFTWRQALAQFKREGLPPVTTHHLAEDDEITDFCQQAGLRNSEDDRVKVIYHPDFIERATSPFSVDYLELVRGCHLGIFPSLYEPWGYAPMETLMHGTPVIASDLSGFGQYMEEVMPDHTGREMHLLRRSWQNHHESVEELTRMLLTFVENFSDAHYIPRASMPRLVMDSLCWVNLERHYRDCYRLALMRYQPVAGLY